jgi:hypothetical protein
MNTIRDRIVYFKNAHMMMPDLILVESDVMDITKRLRKIDKNYFVMFNPRTQKYELHNAEQRDVTLCLNLPFDELDSRTIDHVQKYRIENLKKIIAEMEANNLKIEIEKENRLKDTQREIMKDIYTYCNRHTDKEVLDEGAYKTRFV